MVNVRKKVVWVVENQNANEMYYDDELSALYSAVSVAYRKMNINNHLDGLSYREYRRLLKELISKLDTEEGEDE